jgi:cysteine-S-conjugate beta-lyase
MTAFDFDRIPSRRDTDSNKWRKFPPDVLPLWVADMDFPSPPAVVAALRARVEQGFFGYLTENPELREVVAERLAKRYNWRVEPEAVVPLPGVIAGFNLGIRALTSPGDGLLVQTPVYPPILRAAGNHGLGRDGHALTRGEDGRYTVDPGTFAAAIGARTRAFLLCNPHNPVGRLFERRELEAMAAACLRHDLWILADEIHCDLLLDDRQHVPMATLAPEVERRTLTFLAPSKTFNVPGLKCAVAVVPNAALRQRFTAAASDLVPKINVLGHAAAVAAYREGEEWLAALLRYLEGNRDFLAREVPSRLPGVRMAAPEATYLAWLDCRATGLSDPYTFFLEHAKVALNDGTTFGPGGEGFVRLNFGCPRALLDDGLARMAAALRRHRPVETG